jgi:hypothetical protein
MNFKKSATPKWLDPLFSDCVFIILGSGSLAHCSHVNAAHILTKLTVQTVRVSTRRKSGPLIEKDQAERGIFLNCEIRASGPPKAFLMEKGRAIDYQFSRYFISRCLSCSEKTPVQKRASAD